MGRRVENTLGNEGLEVDEVVELPPNGCGYIAFEGLNAIGATLRDIGGGNTVDVRGPVRVIEVNQGGWGPGGGHIGDGGTVLVNDAEGDQNRILGDGGKVVVADDREGVCGPPVTHQVQVGDVEVAGGTGNVDLAFIITGCRNATVEGHGNGL